MNTETEQSQQPSLGQMLRQAREARGLTLPQVASQLNLAVPLIEKLEQDQFNGNMLETYVKGYIRAYAKLLKIPEKQLIAVFSRENAGQSHVAKPMQTFSNRTKNQTTDKRFLWLTYGIIALFIVLLFVWWWQTEAGFAQPSSDNQASTAAIITSLQQTPQNLSDNATDDIGTGQNDPLVPVEPVSTDGQATTELEQMLVSRQPEASTEALIIQDSLNMRFLDACWVNVIDAAGERIAFGTKEKGYVMTLKGKAPFVVTLGNPAVVSINFNQQPYDISALPTGRVAKFTIPGSE